MTAKTTAERQRAFRAEMRRQGLTEVRGIYAKPEQHQAIKEAAKSISSTQENSMIQYLYQEGVEACSKEPLKVRVNGVQAGEIRNVDGGYQYFPKGARKTEGGEVFPTVEAVQKSLSDE